MAEENYIIFRTQIDGLESIDQLNKQLAEARKQYKENQAGSEKYIEAVAKITEVNGKLDSHKQFLKQVDNQSKSNSNTIEGLRNRYKELAAATVKLDIGSKEFQQTQAEAKRVSDQLKELEKGMGNTSRNVGNYAEGFKEALGGLGGGFGKAITGIQGFNAALSANPIGAVVQVLNLLFNALGKNDDMMVAFQGAMKGIGVVVTQVSSFIVDIIKRFTDFTNSGTNSSKVFVDFGKRLINSVLAPFQLIKDFIPVITNLMDGNFKKAFDAGATAVVNFGKNALYMNSNSNSLIESLGNLTKSGTALEQMLDAVEMKQSALNVELAKNDNLVKRLVLESRNRSKSEQEREKALEKAIEVEKRSVKLRTSLINEQIAGYENYLKTLGKGSTEEEDIQKKLNDLYTQRENAIGDSLNIQEKIATKQAALDEKMAANREKQAAADAKAREEQQKAAEKAYDDRTKLAVLEVENEIKKAKTIEEIRNAEIKKAQTIRDAEVESIYNSNEEKATAEQEFANSLLDINAKYVSEKKKQEDKATKDTEDAAKLQRETKEKNLAMTLTILKNFEQASAALGEEAKVAQKALAITQAIINTYTGAAAALAPPPVGAGPLFGPILAASTIALGLANISTIAAAAGGGDFVTTKPTLLLVGDNPGGRERVTVEPLSGRGQTRIGNSGLIAMAGGGSLSVNPSGMSAISSTASSDVMNQLAMSKSITDTFAKLGNPVVSVVDIKKVSNKTTVTENKARLRA